MPLREIALLIKSYVKAHTRTLKDGRRVEIAAHFNKRIKRGTEHAPDHGHNLTHLSEDDAARFDRMHREQHLRTFYRAHALQQRIDAHRREIQTLHERAEAHTAQGAHKAAAKLRTRAISLDNAAKRHGKKLEEEKAAIDWLAAQKEARVKGSGALDTSDAEAMHEHYVSKLGRPWKKIEPTSRQAEDKPGAAGGDASEADQLRQHWGLTREKLDAYEPENSVKKYKSGSTSRWSVTDINGIRYPVMFGSKKEAVAAARKHKQMMIDKLNDPLTYDRMVAANARKFLDVMAKYEREGMNDWDAAAAARRDVYGVDMPEPEPARAVATAPVADGNTGPVRKKPEKVLRMTMDEWKKIHRDFKGRSEDGTRMTMHDGGFVPVEIIKTGKPEITGPHDGQTKQGATGRLVFRDGRWHMDEAGPGTSKRRAKAGGEYGANGEWYPGGAFINTVAENEKGAAKDRKKGSGKEEIEPYVWEAPPAEGARSIYKVMGDGVLTIKDRATGKMTVNPDYNWSEVADSAQQVNEYINHYEELADAYNAGKRWVLPTGGFAESQVGSAIEAEPAKNAQESGSLPIIEHVTKKGKTIRGVVRKDLTRQQAEAIDPYTFRKDGGFFIREKHLSGGAAEVAAPEREAQDGGGEKPADSKSAASPARSWFKNTKAARLEPALYYGTATKAEMDAPKKEIAQKIRADIKRGIADGRIPSGIKVSVTSDHNSIDLRVTGVPEGFQTDNPDQLVMRANHGWYVRDDNDVVRELGELPHRIPRYSEDMRRVLADLEAIHGKYNWDKSDSMTDYFNKNYYGSVGVNVKHDNGPKVPPPETAIPGDTITVGGNTYTLEGNPPRWHKVFDAKPVQEAQPAAPVESDEQRQARADKLVGRAQKALEDATESMDRDRLANTARRARMAAGAEREARKKAMIARTALNLADSIRRGEAGHLDKVKAISEVAELESILSRARYDHLKSLDMKHDKIEDKLQYEAPEPESADFVEFPQPSNDQNDWYRDSLIKRREFLSRLGITDQKQLTEAMRDYMNIRAGGVKKDPVKELERALIGQKVGIDFFPTPKPLAERMARLAGIEPGDTVLEPSAGNGHLADAAKAAGGQVDAVEVSETLRQILQAKGHAVAGRDFEDYAPGRKYDAVLMNPPFSDRKDAEHIQRAWDMLKPGGRLVAIAGEGVFFGSDKKAQAFREWLDSHGAEVEKLPPGTFQDKSLPSTTGVNARLVVMRKPEEQMVQNGAAKDVRNMPMDGGIEDGSAYRGRSDYEERRQARIDRLEARAERLRQKGNASLSSARDKASAIPFGQPILVGHHSEKRDRKFRDRIHAGYERGFQALERAGELDARVAAAEANTSISSDDPKAVEKLREKLTLLKDKQEKMKDGNKIIKSKKLSDEQKIEELQRLGFSGPLAESSLKPDFAGRIGFPPYMLQNNLAKIKDAESRIEKLMATVTHETREWSGRHARVVDNVEENRVHLDFDGRPDAETRAKLKSNGFRWSPTAGVWQRQRGNTSALYYAKQIAGVDDAEPVAKSLYLFFKPKKAA